MSEAADSQPEGSGAESSKADRRDTQTFEAQEERLFLESEWESLVDLYRQQLATESILANPAAAAELHFRRGQILEERVGDPDGAIEAYWSVAQLQPTHAAALRQLRRIHARREDWNVVDEIAELEAQTGVAPHAQAASLAEIGEMKRAARGDLEGAEASFERSLAIDDQQVDALTGLARTREAQQRPAEAAALWERVVAHQRGPDRAIALTSLGGLLADPLNDPDRAAECFRRALTDDPRNADAVEALVRDAEHREQWPLLSDLVERRFNLAAGARRRTEIALDASRLQLDHLDNPATARHWLDRARELSPDEPQIESLSAAIERRAGNRPALLEALERQLACESSPALEPLLEAAEVCQELDDDERALDHLRGALLAAPSDADVTLRLDRCLSRLCRDAERADVLERRVALASSAREQAELLGEIARLQDEVLEDPEAALAAWGRCFELDAHHPDAASELVARLSKGQQWERLRSVLERACEDGPESRRPDMLCTLGEVSLLRFDDPEAAARAFELALDIAPETTQALEGLAQIAEGSGDDDAIVRAYSREAAVTSDRRRLATLVWELVRVHESRSEHDESLTWLTRLHEAAPDDRACLAAIAAQYEHRDDPSHTAEWVSTLEKLAALTVGNDTANVCDRLVALHRKLENRDEAIRWAESSLEARPEQLEATQALVTLYREERRHEDQARVQRRLADLLSGDEQSACLVDLASLIELQLGDLDAAIVVLWRVASHPSCTAEIRDHLGVLLERAGRYEELAQHLLEQRRRVADDDPEARTLELRRAQLLLDPLSQFDQAGAEFRRLHEADPQCEEARVGLEFALRAGHDIEGLAALLAERAASMGDPTARRRLELERAVLLEEAPSDITMARAAYTELADQTDDVDVAADAATRLEGLLERCGEWAELRTRLESSLERDGAETLASRERLATLCRDRLGDRAGAIEHFEAAGTLAPENAPTWQALALLYDSEGRTPDLQRVISAELACDLEPQREAALRVRGARLCKETDAENARDHYERVLELEAGHAEAVEFLVDHYGAAGQHARLVELLETRLASCPLDAAAPRDDSGRAQRTSLRLRIAALQADSLGDLDAGIATLEAARAETGAATVVAEPLADLLQRAGHSEPLIALCREVAARESEPTERSQWQMRLADALRENGRLDEAVSAYCSVADAAPGDGAANAALRVLYRELDRPEPLAVLLEHQLGEPLSESETVRDRALIHAELAELYASRLSRPDDALAHWREILATDPADKLALQHALDLAEASSRADQVEELLSLGLAHAQASRERADLLSRRGRLVAADTDRSNEAIEDLRGALAIDPNDSRSRAALRRVLEETENWQAALDCLFIEARQATAERRIELLEEGVALSRAHVSIDASLPWLERLRAERPDDSNTISRIAEVHRQAGRPEALLRTLEMQLELEREPLARRDLLLDRSRILERDLASPGRALAALEAANASSPEDPAVIRELARMQADLGLLREHVATLEALIDAISSTADQQAVDAGEARTLHERCADLCASELTEHTRARRHIEAALSLAPERDPSRPDLLAALGASLQAEGRTSEWAATAERELAERDAGSDRARELHEALARAYGAELGARDASLRHWQILDATTGDDCTPEQRDEIERELLASLRALRNPVELEAKLSRWLARHSDDIRGWHELAQLRAEVLHSPSGTADAYRASLAVQPEQLDAWRGLRDAAEQMGDFGQVAETLDRELELQSDASAGERGVLLRRLGNLAWHRLDDGVRAQAAFSQALALDACDLRALRSLQQLHESRSEHTAALALYERECGVLEARENTEDERRVTAWLRAGDLARNYTNEPERALAAYDAAAAIERLTAPREREWATLLIACDQPERHAEILGNWCDRKDAGATARDHLALADHLTELDRRDDALERTRAATRCEDDSRDAWDALARRGAEAAQPETAAEALERAGQLCSGRDACTRYIAAALAIEPIDPARALRDLELAVAADTGDATAHAHLARVAEREGRLDVAERAADRALTTTGETPDTPLDPSLQLEAALVGGRCARQRTDLDAAAIAFRTALRVDGDHAEALTAAGEVLYESGDVPAARELLERRVALDETDEYRGAHLAMIGEALEIAGRDAEALDRFLAAIACEPGLDAAHAGLVRGLELANRPVEAVEALTGWADRAETPVARTRALRHAARIERESQNTEAAISLLSQATEGDADCTDAWCELAELFEGAADDARALDAAEHGETAADRDAREDAVALRARLARVRANALERADRLAEACDAWGAVVASDPRDASAALQRSRMLRHEGDWAQAADTLAEFAENHPDSGVFELAAVHEERARLLAGPLERVEEAVNAYERALVLDPARTESRGKLAALLALVPGRRRDAVVSHAELLRRQPATAASIRGLLGIARDGGLPKCVETGLCIVRAMGIATESERGQAGGRLRLTLGEPLRLDEPRFEPLRLAVGELRQAFDGLPPDIIETVGASEPASAIAQTLARIQAEIAAPTLDALDDASLRDAVLGVAGLALDPLSPEAETTLAAALDAQVGRRALRRARRHLEPASLEELARVDVGRWRNELRGLSAAIAVDRGECELRPALVALVTRDRPDASPGDDADLCALVGTSPAASALLGRAVTRWSERIEREIRGDW